MTLELKNIKLRVGAEMHIYETSLALEAGAFNILLGTTQSGKTTLMRLMAGLERPTEGEIWFNGQNVTGVAVQQRNVAMVYQQFINYPNFNVFNNIASPLKVMGKSKAEINQQVQQVAELLKLTPMLKRMPQELSGGQQQRTALARALVKGADLVLLDEPLANLDYKLREELRDELPKLFADFGTTVVYATSEPTEALLLGGYTAALHQGQVSQFGATADLYHRPSNVSTAKIFSDPPINIVPIEKQQGEFVLDGNIRQAVPDQLMNLTDGVYNLGVRPHHVNLNKSHDQTLSVRGKVLVTEITGSESVLHVEIGEHVWVSQNRGVHQLEIGEEVELHIRMDQCMYFEQSGALIA